MDDHTIEELHRIREQALRLGDTLRSVAAALPARDEGEDPSGLVSVTINATGLPETITVAAPWKNRIRPHDLAAAVQEAAAAAGMRRMESWARELDDRGAADPARPAPPADRRVPDQPDRRPGPPDDDPGGRRPLGDLVEELLDIASRVDEEAGPTSLAATGTATNQSGTVTVVLGVSGLQSVAVDAGWADHRTGSEISRELNSVLAAARARLAAAVEQAGAPARRMDSLLAESLAVLRNPADHLED
ncbi:hypothetical protein ACWEQL_41515 [Kitasatospora sp. NPDC004240]